MFTGKSSETLCIFKRRPPVQASHTGVTTIPTTTQQRENSGSFSSVDQGLIFEIRQPRQVLATERTEETIRDVWFPTLLLRV